jgi:hypothetical protein
MNVFMGVHILSPILSCIDYEHTAKTYGKGTLSGVLDSRTGEHLNDWQSRPTAA